jgi:hypothetical protein
MPFCRCFYQYGYPEFLMPTSLSAAQNLQAASNTRKQCTVVPITSQAREVCSSSERDAGPNLAEQINTKEQRHHGCLLVAAHAQPPSTGHI